MKTKSFPTLVPHHCVSHWPLLWIWICTEFSCFAVFPERSLRCRCTSWALALCRLEALQRLP